MSEQNSDWQPEWGGDWGARVWFPDIMKEGEWHHLVFVFSKQIVKNSSFTLFINGQQVASSKVHYIPAQPGAGAGAGSSSAPGGGTSTQSVFGWIGSPPCWRRPSLSPSQCPAAASWPSLASTLALVWLVT